MEPTKDETIRALQAELAGMHLVVASLIQREGRVRITKQELRDAGGKRFRFPRRMDDAGALVVECVELDAEGNPATGKVVRGVAERGARLRT